MAAAAAYPMDFSHCRKDQVAGYGAQGVVHHIVQLAQAAAEEKLRQFDEGGEEHAASRRPEKPAHWLEGHGKQDAERHKSQDVEENLLGHGEAVVCHGFLVGPEKLQFQIVGFFHVPV